MARWLLSPREQITALMKTNPFAASNRQPVYDALCKAQAESIAEKLKTVLSREDLKPIEKYIAAKMIADEILKEVKC